MKILHYLSLGMWNANVDIHTYELFSAMIVVLMISMVAKLWGNLALDTSSYYSIKGKVALAGRIINVLAYFVVMSILSIFGSINLLICFGFATFGYIIVISILCFTSNDATMYVSIENKFVADIENKVGMYLKQRKNTKKIIHNINKRIYEYQQRTIIG